MKIILVLSALAAVVSFSPAMASEKGCWRDSTFPNVHNVMNRDTGKIHRWDGTVVPLQARTFSGEKRISAEVIIVRGETFTKVPCPQ